MIFEKIPFFWEVDFVAHHVDQRFHASLFPDIFNPFVYIIEWFLANYPWKKLGNAYK